MTITANAPEASAHTVDYSAATYSAAHSAAGSTALSPAVPIPGSYIVRATSATAGLVHIRLSVDRFPTQLRVSPSMIPAAVDPLGSAGASQASYPPVPGSRATQRRA